MTQPTLRVSAHVLVQLGSELVTDVEQALLECVKNSYDADAPGCRIEIDTRARGLIKEKGKASRLKIFDVSAENVEVEFSSLDGSRIDFNDNTRASINDDQEIIRRVNYVGSVLIEDKGDGIPKDKIRESWLVISGSIKRSDQPGPKKPTKKGRTPLGDKGLGRLGTMKLGDILKVESATDKEEPLHSAHFRWSDCEPAGTVDQVPVFSNSKPNVERFKGTKVSILGLKDISDWRRKDRLLEITKSLAKLVSPFEVTSTFPVMVSLDGVEQSLVAVTNQALDRAVAKFTFDWEDIAGSRTLVAKAFFKKRLFTTSRSESQRKKIAEAFTPDDGVGYLNNFKKSNNSKKYDIKPVPEKGWFIELESRFAMPDILFDEKNAMEDPGPFDGAFYFFHLDDKGSSDGAAAAGIEVDSKLIKDMAGISLLRDGFRVRSQGDWLGISEGMTSGSTYHMRVNNTVGYFALTGKQNYRLTEKSDREGFVEDGPYRGFYALAKRCRMFANDALEDVRRGFDKYYATLIKGRAGIGPAETPLSIVNKSVASLEAAQDNVSRTRTKLDEQIRVLQDAPEAKNNAAFKSALNLLEHAKNSLEFAAKTIADTEQTKAALTLLKFEKDQSFEREIALYESAAVGLSARGLGHELRTHITDLRQRATAILKVAKNESIEDAINPHVKTMRASFSAIASAASLIDPLLPRSRNLKDRLSLKEFIQEYLDLRRESFDREDIEVNLIATDIYVRANRARLLQVLDNLVRNSVFWLRRGRLSKTILRSKEINIFIDHTGFAVADSGPGVDPRLEDSLFDIFVSGKNDADSGQGLGLFIIKQLLEADGCEIRLNPARNQENRRYRFDVDLQTIIVG